LSSKNDNKIIKLVIKKMAKNKLKIASLTNDKSGGIDKFFKVCYTVFIKLRKGKR